MLVQHKSIKDTFKNTPRILPAQPEKKQGVSYKGRIANYKTETFFELPPEIAAFVDQWESVKVTPLGNDTWEFSRGYGIGVHTRKVSMSRKALSIYHSSRVDGLFGISPAEYVIVDGQVLASVTQKNPVGLPIAPKSKPRPSAQADATPEPETSKPAVVSNDDMRQVEDMHVALNLIRRIEARTPYRLSKLKDSGWAFVAPIIK